MIRDCVQPKTHGMARRSSRPPVAAGPLGRAGADVHLAELVDGRGRHEERHEAGVAHQRRGRRPGRGRRRGPSSRSSRRGRLAAAATCRCSTDASRTAASAISRLNRPSPGSVYLSLMHLALLGDLDRAVEAAVGLGQDRLAGRAATAADRAAAAVEEPQHDAVLAGDVAQRALRPVDLPLGRGDSRVLGASRSSRA